MKNILILGGMTIIVWIVVSLQQVMFPPPPAEYKVVYLGSPNCGICVHWKSKMLPAWKKDSASSYAKLEIAQSRCLPVRGGYCNLVPGFREAFQN